MLILLSTLASASEVTHDGCISAAEAPGLGFYSVEDGESTLYAGNSLNTFLSVASSQILLDMDSLSVGYDDTAEQALRTFYSCLDGGNYKNGVTEWLNTAENFRFTPEDLLVSGEPYALDRVYIEGGVVMFRYEPVIMDDIACESAYLVALSVNDHLVIGMQLDTGPSYAGHDPALHKYWGGDHWPSYEPDPGKWVVTTDDPGYDMFTCRNHEGCGIRSDGGTNECELLLLLTDEGMPRMFTCACQEYVSFDKWSPPVCNIEEVEVPGSVTDPTDGGDDGDDNEDIVGPM